jgi:hypothetical protein
LNTNFNIPVNSKTNSYIIQFFITNILKHTNRNPEGL